MPSTTQLPPQTQVPYSMQPAAAACPDPDGLPTFQQTGQIESRGGSIQEDGSVLEGRNASSLISSSTDMMLSQHEADDGEVNDDLLLPEVAALFDMRHRLLQN